MAGNSLIWTRVICWRLIAPQGQSFSNLGTQTGNSHLLASVLADLEDLLLESSGYYFETYLIVEAPKDL